MSPSARTLRLRGGIDLGGTKIEAIVVDSRHKVLGSARVPTPTSGGPPDVATAMSGVMTEAAVAAGVEVSALVGVGVGSPGEIDACAPWLEREFDLLRTELVIPVGRLAIGRFLEPAPLKERVGRSFRVRLSGREADCIPLPHPSGASPWHRMEPGSTLLSRGLGLIASHPAVASRFLTHGSGFAR